MEEIVRSAGKQFDGEVVEAFKRVMEKKLEKA
jgi:HD-GYP domain-containing protein (c-di-GMP phosphodiesterase class II)